MEAVVYRDFEGERRRKVKNILYFAFYFQICEIMEMQFFHFLVT